MLKKLDKAINNFNELYNMEINDYKNNIKDLGKLLFNLHFHVIDLQKTIYNLRKKNNPKFGR